MTNIRLRQKIEYKKNLAPYLSELRRLTGTDVSSESLISVEDTEKIRQKWLYLKDTNTNKIVIDFSEKNSERFKKFITNLNKANSSPVYIWTEKSNMCGLYKAASIDAINFDFPFDISPDGIFVFVTEDLENELLLDYYYDSGDREMLEIEWQGKHWHSVSY